MSTQAPRMFPSSATVRYRVSITNTGDNAYPLQPCPSYQEYLVVIVPGSQPVYAHPSFYLNCEAVPEIPAQSTVVFAMEFSIPAAPGEAKFGWILNVAGSPGAGTMVQVAPQP